ncbi:MAG TPA: glycosyltransferase family 39 protein [Candidatus Limnocylindria bacterium]
MSWRVALALFGLALLTRLAFATTNLYAPDSVLYARGMEMFDPFDHRPQPPGYLWYILVLRAIDLVTHDPNRAMTIVSALAGAATVALVYLLAARLYDERTAKVSALFLLTAVTFWAYGGVAYPYTLLAALTTICALLFWRAMDPSQPRPRRGLHLVVASIAWGLAIGFRSDLAIFLAPLWVLAATRATIATAAVSAGVVAALAGLWVFASGLADGGLARFLEAVSIQSKFVDDRYSVFGNGPIAIYRNTYELGRFLGRGLYFLIPLVAATLISVEARRVELRDRWRTVFMVLWTFAPLPFYVFVHIGEYGYIFSMLPGLVIIAARGSIALAKGLRMPRTFKWLVAAVVLGNAAIFLLSDTSISARDIARHDRGIDEKVAYLASFAPDSTQVVTAYDDVLVNHYLHGPAVLRYDPVASPEFVMPLACDAAPAHKPCADTDVDVVLWDDLLRAVGPGWQEVRMPHGGRLRIAHVARSASLRVSEGLGVEIVR